MKLGLALSVCACSWCLAIPAGAAVSSKPNPRLIPHGGWAYPRLENTAAEPAAFVADPAPVSVAAAPYIVTPAIMAPASAPAPAPQFNLPEPAPAAVASPVASPTAATAAITPTLHPPLRPSFTPPPPAVAVPVIAPPAAARPTPNPVPNPVPTAPVVLSEDAPPAPPAAALAPTLVPDLAPTPAAAPDPMAPRADAPIFQIRREQNDEPRPTEAPATDGGSRYYSIHRQAGRTPDTPRIPEPVYLDALPVELNNLPDTQDLAEPPPPPALMRDAQGRIRPAPEPDPSLD